MALIEETMKQETGEEKHLVLVPRSVPLQSVYLTAKNVDNMEERRD
jgi:hypothetical protein